ncbi:Vms1/Ankzf1 family peptidyl-tRNA hydrolase [Streptomyces sp. NPDC101393]|uniref:baeRF2 domain-containing protein n=1 Tax=Streptomyces sp. NPDC101393 TaxID=3366141 RepID=UPI00381F003F
MQLSLLQPVIDRPGPWASVYADASHHTEDAAKQQELAARAAADRLFALGADEATCGAVHEALTASPRAGESAANIGRAVFATAGEVVLDESLPGRPTAPFTTWGQLPRLTPLIEALGSDPVCLVVYVDRTGATFVLRTDRGSDAAGEVAGDDWPVHRTATSEWSESRFQAKVENTWEHNAEEIAGAARGVFDTCDADVVLLVGDPRERRSVFHKLPEPVRAVTYESEHGGRAHGAQSELLERDIAQVRAAHEREHVDDVVGRFRTGAGPGGSDAPYAVAGVPSLLDAAREHRIDTLLIGPDGSDVAREVWVGPGADQLAVRGSELQYLGEVHPTPARADDALVRSAMANGAETVVVRDPAQAPSGGLGALLRWAEPGHEHGPGQA